MPTRNASATWNGDLKGGNRRLKGSSGTALQGKYSFNTRFGDEPGTNPEELMGASHAACFSMALAVGLSSAGLKPQRATTAAVTLDKVGEAFRITKIKLNCEASVPGADAKKFQEIANATKTGCPISAALSAVPIELEAKLV